MKYINWAQKLSSRKMWAAITSVIICSCAIFGVDALTVDKLTALIMAVGSLITYIVSESAVDAAAVSTEGGE